MSMPARRTALREADRRVVAELAERDQRGQLAHPVDAHQRPATGLAAGQPAQLALQRGDLRLDGVDHRQRDLDPLAGVLGDLDARQELAALAGAQLLGGAVDAVVKQCRLDALAPRGRLVGEAKAHQRVNRERRIAYPGIPIVPVADAAEFLGQAKRGRGETLVEIDAKRDGILFEQGEEILELNDALDRLDKFSPRQRQVVELRYFGVLSLEETAEAMNVSMMTVRRDWLAARAWLKGQIRPGTAR